MRHVLRITLLAFLALAGAMPEGRAAPAIGEPAPDFRAATADGGMVHLGDLRGHIVVLEWTSDACPFVRKFYRTGTMQRLQSRLVDAGAIWLSILSDAPGAPGYADAVAARDIATRKASYATHIVLDPEGLIARLYDARSTPHMVLIDAEGRLRYWGAIDDRPSARLSSVEGAHNYLAAAFDALQRGQPVAIEKTRPYGCAIHLADP
ncbi:MAG: thioredoxin family protein [Alphaproteobacteria bacterium]|nr:MAG: thioredoxin family protein [Alphaproteobacteria bacterium]